MTSIINYLSNPFQYYFDEGSFNPFLFIFYLIDFCIRYILYLIYGLIYLCVFIVRQLLKLFKPDNNENIESLYKLEFDINSKTLFKESLVTLIKNFLSQNIGHKMKNNINSFTYSMYNKNWLRITIFFTLLFFAFATGFVSYLITKVSKKKDKVANKMIVKDLKLFK